MRSVKKRKRDMLSERRDRAIRKCVHIKEKEEKKKNRVQRAKVCRTVT